MAPNDSAMTEMLHSPEGGDRDGLRMQHDSEGLQVVESSDPEVMKVQHDIEGLQVPEGRDPEVFPEHGLETVDWRNHGGAKSPRGRWYRLSGRSLLIFIIIALIIIGAVIGGAVGGTVSKEKNTPSEAATNGADNETPPMTTTTTTSSISTSTSTSTSSSAAPTKSILPLDCPKLNGTTHVSGNTTFLIMCQTDFKPVSNNIDQALVNTLDECMDRCAAYNQSSCDAITWDGNLNTYPDANCFLKHGINGTGVYVKDHVQAGALVTSRHNISRGIVR